MSTQGDVPERARSHVKSWRELRNAIDTLNQRIDNATPGGGASGSGAPGGSAGEGGVSGGGVSSGGGVTAPNDSAFIFQNESDGADDTLLTNRRILTAGDNITLSDAGAAGALTIASKCSKALFASTANAVVQNTINETSFAPAGVGSATIAANSLVVGQIVRIRASGILRTV